MPTTEDKILGVSGLLAAVAGIVFLISRRLYFTLAIVLAILVVISIGFFYLSQPTLLSVAVGPAEGKDARLMSAVENVLEGHRAGVRLRPIATSGDEENRALLANGQADLAIIRADQGFPGDSSIVMILRTNVLVVVAPSKLDLESFSQLKGKRVGLVVRSPLDEAGVTRLLNFYGMQSADIKWTVIKQAEVGPLTDNGRLDAVMVFGPIVDPEVAAVVYAVDSKKKKGPTILAIDLSGLAEANTAAASEVTIPKHAFSRRLVPDDDVDTIGVPTILAGNTPAGPIRAKIRAQAVMELARNMFDRRSELSQKLGYTVAIEKPDNDKGVRFPVHPGAAAYLDDTDITWFTLFSDQIWSVWLVGGVAASAGAGLLGAFRRPRADPMQEHMDRLRSITQRARADPDALDALTDELSDLAVEIAALAYERRSGSEEFAPVQLAYENARFAIQTARERQAKQAAAPPS
jgi:TRAP transporter TAXI family solute receptor